MANQNHMIIDPTDYVPGDVDSTGVYVAGDGILKHSGDGGQTWTNLLTSAGTPPDTAGDAEGTVNTDLNYTKISFNETTGDVYFLAEWQNASSVWRMWLLMYDGVSTYTWLQYGTGITGSDPAESSSGVDWDVELDPDAEAEADEAAVSDWNNAGNQASFTTGTAPTMKAAEVNGKDMIDFNSASSEYLTAGTSYGSAVRYWTWIGVIRFDFIGTTSTDRQYVFGIRDTDFDTFVVHIGTNGGARIEYLFGDGTTYSRGTTTSILTQGETVVIALRYTEGDTAVDVFRNGNQATIHEVIANSATSLPLANQEMTVGRSGTWANYYFDGLLGQVYLIGGATSAAALSDADILSYSQFLASEYGFGGASESKPLGLTADHFAGASIYTTEWDGADIRLTQKNTTTLVESNGVALGAATEAQMTARTFYAQPFSLGSPSGASNTVFVYGRWGATVHIAKSTDGAFSVGANLGDGTWGTQWVSEFFALDQNTMFAFLASGTPALWKTTDGGTSWTNLGTLPFDVAAASLSATGIMAICNLDTGTDAQQVAMSESPFSTWTDANTGLDTTGGKTAIRWV